MAALVYLIPTVLHDGQTNCLPAYLIDAVKQCNAFFVENERSARRYLKLLWKARLPQEQDIVIDNYEWYNMSEVTEETISLFRKKIKEHKTIGILSEAGCPGIADPGQKLVAVAHEENVVVKPLVGPNSVLLALMASGMNGQHFQFVGYLPIQSSDRIKAIKTLETESKQKNCTQIFIETPYRNNQLLETLVKTCNPQTKICVAVDLTAETESIQTKTVQQWKQSMFQLHKRPAIFMLWSL